MLQQLGQKEERFIALCALRFNRAWKRECIRLVRDHAPECEGVDTGAVLRSIATPETLLEVVQ